MKKKILALALAAILLVGGIVGGAFAYLTDESEIAENVFVLGDIDITMHELMRDKNDPNKLVAFEQNQLLLPGYTNMQWQPYYWGQAELDFDGAWTQGTAADPDSGDLPYTCWNDLFNTDTYGVMDKFVFVENTGKTDAYFRTVIAVEDPVGLTPGVIHYNISSFTGYDWNQNTDVVDTGVSDIEVIEGVVIEGVRYKLIVANYVNVLEPGEVARPSFLQVGLGAEATNLDMELLGEELTVLVATQAVQVYGFEDNALAALAAAFGKVTVENHPFNPVWDGTADTSWYNDTDTEFVLNTAEEFAGLAKLVNEGNNFVGKTVSLGADMDLGNKEWTPIGISGANFNGTFDGAGHTVKNLKALTTEKRVGLFGATGGSATIKNVTVDGATLSGQAYVGGIVGYSYGSIIDCTVKNASIYSNNKAGSIVALLATDAKRTVSGCYAENVDIVADRDAGCMIGCSSLTNNTHENNTWNNVTVTFDNTYDDVDSGKNIVADEIGRK